MAYSGEMKVFSGTGSKALTQRVCDHLGQKMGHAICGTFSDGEIRVQIGDNIRGKDVFIVNSTSPPVNDHLMELLILIDAAKRASADRVTAVLPYFGYARQDRKDKPRVSITAKLVSNLIVAAGADRVLTLDLHCGQIQGFFDIPMDHLSGEREFERHVRDIGTDNMVVVSPDMGSVKRAREMANRLNVPLALVDKRRPRENEAEVMNLIGDVEGLDAVIFDDLVDTAGTLCNAAKSVIENGAKSVRACITHPVLSGAAIDRVTKSVLTELLVSDSIPLSEAAKACPKIKVVSFAPLLGKAISRIHNEESLTVLFE